MSSQVNEPLISVIIPTYNRAQQMFGAIDSVLGQTYKNLELIVVNDGSKDNTAEELAKIDDHRVFPVSKHNQGLSEARNTGASFARGKYLAFLDDDDIWLPKKLERQLAFMNEHNLHTTTTDYYIRPQDSASAYLRSNSTLARPEWLIVTGSGTRAGSTLVVRKDIFDKVGGFDKSTIRTEDWDWVLRHHREYPGQLKIVPEPLTIYNGAHRTAPDIEMISIQRIVDKHWDIFSQNSRAEGRALWTAALWMKARIEFGNHQAAPAVADLVKATAHSPINSVKIASVVLRGHILPSLRPEPTARLQRELVDVH
jgi:glycosyltransferase involved in cell wall biosynthesis